MVVKKSGMVSPDNPKSFLSISSQECLEVYKAMVDVSDSKWKSAESLATQGDYGTAISLAIISIEELIKSMVIFMDGKGFEFRKIKGIDTIFKHHQLRYFIAFAMFIISIFSEDIFKLFSEIRKDPHKIKEFNDFMKKDEGKSLERRLMWYAFRKLVLIKKEVEWFSQVNIFRQKGFYSDYEDSLSTPISIDESEYNGVIQRLEKVRMVGKGIIESYENTDEITLKYLAITIEEFKSQKFYENIEQSLTSIQKTKINPFTSAREFWESI